MRQVEKRKFSCFCDTQLPTVCRLPFAVNVMLKLSITEQCYAKELKRATYYVDEIKEKMSTGAKENLQLAYERICWLK